MHWGTFALSLEPPLEPPKRFREAAAKAGYNPNDVWVMKVGETRLFSRTPAASQPALPRTP